MKKFKLSKRYILKMVLTRAIILGAINITYLVNIHKVPAIYSVLMLNVFELVNIIGLVLILIEPIISYLAYSYSINNIAIEIKRGVFFRKSIYIPNENIKYLIVQKGPIDHLLRINNIKIYTTAGHEVIKALTNHMIANVWCVMDKKVSEKNDLL